jgi:hypothetical protein
MNAREISLRVGKCVFTTNKRGFAVRSMPRLLEQWNQPNLLCFFITETVTVLPGQQK